MAVSNTAPAVGTAKPPLDPAALRIVLFGMPDAGKSSLLGALAQAAQTQERALQGRLVDLSQGLAELRRRVYEERSRETLEEIIPYPVTYEPYTGNPQDLSGRRQIVLYDCDGRVANALLTRRQALDKDANAGGLAHAILEADALVLVIDASANADQIDADFREFARFLRFLESYRARGREVGGLPIYLVLSKCDLLARDRPTRAEWDQRIADRKRQVADRFKEFLVDEEDEDEGPYLPFGSVDLRVWATAVKRPDLADVPGQPREPLNVAELFQDCFEAADEFRRRTRHSQRRLFWTVVGVLGMLGVMLALAVALVLTRPQGRPPLLVSKIESYRAREGPTASTRLAGPLQRHISELIELEQDPEFEQISPELQQYVKGRLAELEAYQKFQKDLNDLIPPTQTRSLGKLRELEEALTKRIVPPQPYQQEWGQTQAALTRARYLKEIPVLRQAVEELRDFYNRLGSRGTRLLFTPALDSEWQRDLKALFDEADAPPVQASDRLRGAAFEFDEVVKARENWQKVRDRLARVRDMASALGIVGDPLGPRAVLVVPEAPPDDPNAFASGRLQLLKKFYPNYASWSLAEVPEKVEPDLRRQLRRNADRMLRAGQQMVLRKLRQVNPDGRETHADWLKVAAWLPTPAVAEWRDFDLVFVKLLDPKGDDPVGELAAFLKRPAFDLDLRSLRLTIPDDLRDTRVRPNGKLTVYLQPAGGAVTTLTFRQEGEGFRVRQGAMTYHFVPEGEAKLTYRPGDAFWADLPARDANREVKFTWTVCKSMVYQFERLAREPRLHAPDQQPTEGEKAEGVSVVVDEGRFPSVPALLPVVPRR